MHEIADAALPALPIYERDTEVRLMRRKPDPSDWSITHRFRLGQ